MSYEGYEQCICERGHYFELDAMEAMYGDDASRMLCRECGSAIAWSNSVDETNGHSYGIILQDNLDEFLDIPEYLVHCVHCDNVTVRMPAIYLVPTQEETIKLRRIWMRHIDGRDVYLPLEKVENG